MTKKTVSKINIVWTNECERSFNKLKEVIFSEPVLRSPNHDKQMILQTDASNRGIGAVLSQVDDNGEEHPIVYIIRKLLPREERYSIVEKECLAIVQAVKTLNIYILGIDFILQTDHHALYWLDRIQTKNARLARWSLYLQSWTFRVQYRKGKETGMQIVYPRDQVLDKYIVHLKEREM